MASSSPRIQIIFRKGEGARFLSHLDLMATLEYAVRRARLPVELSEGFNPRPRMTVAAPLALGHVGEEEILEIVLRSPVPSEEVVARLQAALPPGLTILAGRDMAAHEPQSAARVRSAIYRIELPIAIPDLQNRVATLMGQTTLEIEEQREGKRSRRRDLRPFLLELQASDNGDHLHLTVQLSGEGSVRPEQVLELLKVTRDGVRITRERVDLDD